MRRLDYHLLDDGSIIVGLDFRGSPLGRVMLYREYTVQSAISRFSGASLRNTSFRRIRSPGIDQLPAYISFTIPNLLLRIM